MRICNFSQQLVISDEEGTEANELQGKNPCCPACLLRKWRTGRQGSRKEECRLSAEAVRLFSIRSYWFLMNYINVLRYTLPSSVYNIPPFCTKYMTVWLEMIWEGAEMVSAYGDVKGKRSLKAVPACTRPFVPACMDAHLYLSPPKSCWLKCFSLCSRAMAWPRRLSCWQRLCQALLLLMLFQAWISPARFISVSAFPYNRSSQPLWAPWDLWAKSTDYSVAEDAFYRNSSVNCSSLWGDCTPRVMLMWTFNKYIFSGESNNQIFIPMTDECTMGLGLAKSIKNIGHVD